TSYGYEVGQQLTGESGGTRTVLHLVELTEPASPVPTRFDYDELSLSTGGGSPRTVVTDRRGETTTYDFNRFGGVERMEDPLGHVSLTEWIPGDVLIARSRNARGIWTEYEYDAHGNVLSETVGPPGDRFVSTMTYAGPGDFERPYIKNRMETKVDRDGDLTTLTYDSRGNLLSETTDLGRDPQGQNLGSLTVSHTYDELGDRRTMTDGRGFTTEYRFDDYGYPRLIIDPLGHTTQLEHDIRGRTIRTVDGEQNETLLAYDGLDRLTFQQFATGDFEATDYDDAGLRRLRTDASGRVTVTTFDREGRIARLDNAAGGSRVFGYSAEGDKILESLWFDAATPRHDIEYRYDAAGRLERRIEPLGRVTVYEHDAVGNVVSETLLDTNDPDFEPRVMTWPNYDALNRPLAEEKRLVDPLTGLERTLTTTFTWSGEGQKVAETDPLGRTTRWVYDGLDRLLQLAEGETTQHAALRVTRKIYDGNGNLVEETLENPLGAGDQTRRFVYDAAGRLTSEVDAEGHAAFYKYDRASNVIREIDRRGTVVEHDYDVRNRRVLTRLRLSRGRDEAVWAETSYSYDPVSNPVRERQANGNVVVTTFDGLDRVTEIRDSVGAVASLRYDARSNRISQTDGEGHESRVYFDALDRPIRMELPEDRVVERSFDVAGNTLTEKNPRGFASTYRYDTLERLRQVIDPPVAPATDGYRLTATYDDVGNVVAVMNRRGFTTDLTYDALNRPVRRLAPEINGERYEMTTSWDAADNMLSSIDPRGISTELTYDLENRRRTTTRAELLLETLEYDAAGSVRFVTDARGHTTGFEYDERGQVLTLNQPEAATTRHTYDLVGNRVRTVDPELRQLQWTHDLRNRMASERIEVEADRFATTFYEHDLRNLRTAVVRPKGEAHRQEWRYDGAGRLASVQMPDGGVTVYRYDPGGNLIEQTDAEACITRFAYDALDRRSQLTYPDGAVKRWTFDESSNTATRTDPSGRTTHFAYDALDREISRDLPLRADAALADQLDRIDWAWDRNNNLLQVDEAYTASGLHSTTRTYDAFDRPETVTDRFGREIVYQYDAVGNRTGLTAPNQSTQYTYDALNRLEAVTNGAGVTTYEYHRNSTLDRVAYPNGTTASYSYDTANRLEQITHFQGSAEISRYAYRYDDHSNRVRQEEFQLGHGTEVTTYDFDLNDRLELVVYPEKTVTYGYDQVGNRVTETIQPAAGGSPETKSYAYDVRHRLETITHALEPNEDVTYGYDPNGNQVQKTKNGLTVDYVFDALDRLTRIEEEGLPQGIYTFDYQGLRVQKQAKGRQVQYLYDDQSVLQRHDSVDGQISYDYGPDRLLSVDHPSAGRSFYLFDAMGSVVGLTTPSGSVSAQYSYDAFGSYRRQTETEGNVFGYTGHETDGESGLIYARARFYDPDVGLFLSEDPAQDDYLNPPSLHKYAYAFQNPTVYTDPTGEVEFFRKNVVGFFKRGGVDNAAEAAVGIEEEYGKAAGLVSAGVLGVLGAGAEMMAGIGEVANVAINVAVVTVAPTSSLGQQAADELDAAILATEQAARGLYQAATWAIENPSEAGAIAVEAAKELGGNLAGGDVRTVTKTVAFVAEMAAGGRGGLSGVRKLKDAAEAGAKRSTQRAVRTSSRMPEKPKPQSRGQAQPAQYCFAAGTPVAAAEGLVPIETVEEGDLVWARNDKTGEVQLRRVAQTFVTPGKRIWEVEIESADGEIETISTTAEHPFYVVGLKWVPAARLEPGDPLIGLNGETGLTVRQVRGSPRYETVYNFEVEVDHTYFVGESLVWVHNLCSEGRVRLSLLKRRQRQRQKGIHVPFDNEGFQTHLIKSRAALTRKFRPATHHQSNFINGRLTIMKKNDRFVQLLNSTLGSTGKPMNPSRAGFLDVVAHGSPEEIAFDIHRQAPKVNHRVLASYLRSKDEFRGQKIRLISCSTGQGCDSFAQRLADKLKVEVQGPSELVWASGEMPMFVAGQKGGRPAGFGEWKFFKPRNEYSRQD
ncbi:MAG: polymorphic toxin-type HINT domain-containing protein, partial [Acidobacteriota bacterium]